MRKLLIAGLALVCLASIPTTAKAGYEHEFLNPNALGATKTLGTDTDSIICKVLAADATNVRPIYIACSDFAKLAGPTFTGLVSLTGNLKVGNGTPGVTLDGEDAYVEGTLEVDGTATFDGATDLNGALTVGTDPTSISAIRFAFDAVANGQTSKTTTLTGATASSRCIASAAETATNAVYIRSVVPGTNQVVITTSGDPGASNLDYTVFCLN